MQVSRTVLQTKSLLARAWKPRAAPTQQTIDIQRGRHPERFESQIVLSDGSSFRVRSTAPRAQVKISKDTRTHALWNPQAMVQIDDEGGYLSSFQKKFEGYGSPMDFNVGAEVKVPVPKNQVSKRKQTKK
ncbi:hypothetical protein GGH12_005387 [Coemansia sp. RSA 1822]|nr:hypothetical protein LPJ76_005515 [Coemansia sp. RSA 638]KAJ2120481.1 hypothetical protein IW147_005053 [Coemansia sp. RSA 720]KAJ2539422.1 hypothetical protein GGF49_005230 [Coemansia sp. RSA 1853]KAJ2559450.1 hypothetical protein GGH12_005387 [Coemansia sp. RSA 1822]KAJ2655630.1 hypothetical protein IW148_005968 [Coemansia sp. RSA 1199]